MARLVWHCPFILIFTSDNTLVTGDNFREFGLIRLDGETWLSDMHAENIIEAEQTKDFGGWNHWKEKNKEGQDCELFIKIQSGQINISAEYCGLSIHSITTVTDDIPKLYAALTGDQCAITNIRINR